MVDSTLAGIENLLKQQPGRPPVEKWDPELSGNIDIVIRSNGDWYHEGGLISRHKLVVLFSSILRREQDGEYYLLTPVEKWRIQVDDALFIITDFEVIDEGLDSQSVILISNVGCKWLLSNDFCLSIDIDINTQEPSPYLKLDRGLKAKLSRNVFYALIEKSVESEGCLLIRSDNASYSLGDISA